MVEDDADGPSARGAAIGGKVLAILPRALYRVAIGGGREIVAHAEAGPGRNFVRLVVGDGVLVEISPRNAGRGRIVKRT